MTTILIVEDDELMARLYRKVFNFEGFQVEMAANGRLGLDKAREVKPDIIMLDVMMPEMNGLEALDKLKADPNLKQIPVIMLTNLAGQQDAELALSKGAAKYVIKSEEDPKGVAAIVKEVLGGSATPTAAPAAVPASAPTPAAVATPVPAPASTPVATNPTPASIPAASPTTSVTPAPVPASTPMVTPAPAAQLTPAPASQPGQAAQ